MYADPGCRGVLTALKALARRHQHLTDEINDLDHDLAELVQHTVPHLLQLHAAAAAIGSHP